MTSESLARALDQTERLIAAVGPDRASLPTPCPQWTVRDLVEHLVGADLHNFVVRARGETVEWTAAPEPLGDDWVAQFHDAATHLQAAWSEADPSAPEFAASVDQQITELSVHDWDLALALGVGDTLDEALAEHALAWARTMLRPEHRGPDKAIGLEVPVPADAAAYARLAGFFGRDPAWRPPS